jgi:hypothetical protein
VGEKRIDMQEMIDYLKELEELEDFIPWDDVNHAAKHLETKFHVLPMHAMDAVLKANVSTKQATD